MAHLLLSGPLSVGKTTLARQLAAELDYLVVPMRYVLRGLARVPLRTRADLQRFGAQLEAETRGAWVVAPLQAALGSKPPAARLIVDALRTPAQVQAARGVLAPLVVHMHLTADASELTSRFNRRVEDDIVEAPYHGAVVDTIEEVANLLSKDADTVIDTTGRGPIAVYEEVRRLLTAGPGNGP